jgi:hypothetical protein
MTDFTKAYWATDGDSISVRMPITKVDKERRIVSGWATTDVLDKQGDIVSSEASARAFENFLGNVREQHTPLAVGKVVSFKQDKFFDKNENKFYNGMYVDVYVSKGAEDTWHKVNEGILTGFSIGGSIKDSENVYNKSMDQEIRVIKEYDLHELSLVDNPANPASTIVSVQKFDNVVQDIEKNYLENVYWCSDSDVVILSEKADYPCPDCNKHMTNIGFVESNDVNKSDSVKNLINSFTKASDIESENMAIDEEAKSIAENIEKEGNKVGILNKKTKDAEIAKSEETVEDAVETTEEAVEEAIEKSDEVEEVEVAEDTAEVAEEATEEVVEKADTTEEVIETEEVVEKSTTPAEDSTDDLAKAVSEIKDSVADAIADLAAVVKGIADQVAEVKKSLDGVSEEVNVVKGNVAEFGERIDEVEADTAVRKSGDLGGIVQENKIRKSMWGGRFLNSADLYR